MLPCYLRVDFDLDLLLTNDHCCPRGTRHDYRIHWFVFHESIPATPRPSPMPRVRPWWWWWCLTIILFLNRLWMFPIHALFRTLSYESHPTSKMPTYSSQINLVLHIWLSVFFSFHKDEQYAMCILHSVSKVHSHSLVAHLVSHLPSVSQLASPGVVDTKQRSVLAASEWISTFNPRRRRRQSSPEWMLKNPFDMFAAHIQANWDIINSHLVYINFLNQVVQLFKKRLIACASDALFLRNARWLSMYTQKEEDPSSTDRNEDRNVMIIELIRNGMSIH